jgi:hypothetical protein
VSQRLYAYEGLAALLAVGLAYTLVSDRLRVGPVWLPLAVLGLGTAVTLVLRWRGLFKARRIVAIALLALATIAIASSAVFLIGALVTDRAQAGNLLVSAALLWASNVLVFGLWYWEVDGGGPHNRKPGPNVSSDFLFPQEVSGGDRAANWYPQFLDYLFLAFNTSTAFSPTDTMVLARRSKVLMMLQSIISLATVAVIAARAINTL